ncbi:hypothetical protein ACFLYA_00370 [Candidatus Dependentiae bacterium]
MKLHKVFFIIFCLFCFFNIQAKIYLDENKKEVAREDSVFDVCIFLDQWSDLSWTYKDKSPGAAVRGLEKVISQGEAIIASGMLIDSLVSISKNQEFAKKSGDTLKIFSPLEQSTARSALRILDRGFFRYKTKGGEFVVLIPRKSYEYIIGTDGKELEKIGLNPQVLQKMNKQDFEKLFKGIDPNLIEITQKDEVNLDKLGKEFEKEKYTINVDLLGDIFSTNEAAKKIEKRIYLDGHGSYGKNIAQLNYEDYETLLRKFQEVNCVFLYVSSCYAGGMSQVDAQKEIRKEHGILFKRFLPRFIIVAGGLPDVATHFETLNFRKFFRSLHDFLFKTITSKQIALAKGGDVVAKERVQDWIKEKKWVSKDSFKEILANIAGKDLKNMPSIYIPHIYNEHGFFDALTVDEKVKVITFPYILQKELEAFQALLRGKIVGKEEVALYRKKLEEEKKKKTKKRVIKFEEESKKRMEELKKLKYYYYPIKQIPHVVLGSSVKYALIYPSVINVPIIIDNTKIISITPGNFHHYLKELSVLTKISASGKRNILKKITTLLAETFGIKGQKSKKAFFVGEIKAFNAFDNTKILLQNVAIATYTSKERFIQDVFFEYDGAYWFYKFVNGKLTKPRKTKKFESAVYKILKATTPDEEVQKYAKKGIIPEAVFRKMIIDLYIKNKD